MPSKPIANSVFYPKVGGVYPYASIDMELPFFTETVIFNLFPSIIEWDNMTSETTTATQAQNVEVGCLDKKDVITTDGRIVGQLTGAYIDTTSWVVNGLMLEVNKDVIDALNMKKPILRTAKAKIMPSLVKVVSDTVQLNVSISDLAGNVTVVD